MEKLTHIDKSGKAKMVDVTEKTITVREAVAGGTITMKPATLQLILANEIKKGDVLGVAKIAGVMAAKRVGELIPLCHPLSITSVDISFTPDEERSRVDIRAAVKVASQTGVEMEALTAVTVAALTIYDMCKAVDREMEISEVVLLEKRGGKSGEFLRKGHVNPHYS
ncbi:MAG: cyclic pyranopterin monophosphate synthase MoaC [Thermodesulfobacteriota bacterium]